MNVIRRNRLKPTNCLSKLSTIVGIHHRSGNNSKHHYSSSMMNINNQSKRITGFRRSVEGIRLSHNGKENKNPRISVGRQKGTADYEYLMEVGEGAFGKVWKVRHRQSGNIYALKVMLKLKILAKKSVDSVSNQRVILSKLKNSKFIVNAVEAFQDQEYLYLLMQYMPKGDLRYIIYSKSKTFSQQQAKFLICCLISAVRFLHKHEIIHRDIKPQNLVLDGLGYLRLTDMGISKIATSPIKCDGSGTPAYMAPQSFESGQQTFQNDYYAIGVIAFELLNGRRPYVSKVREQIYEEIQQRKKLKYDSKISIEAKMFCQGLLTIEPSKRLGIRNGVCDLENHPWFQDVNWVEFRKKKYRSPFTYKNSEKQMKQYQKLLQSSNQQSKFRQNVKLKPQFQFLFKNYNHIF